MNEDSRRSDRIEFGLYLPQLQLDFETLRERTLLAERLGFDTLWLYDHLYPPGMPDVPDMDGWTLISALSTLTTRIRLGQLVLCNGFHHPALLARQAITLDVVSQGRLELGLGTGSNLAEFAEFGIPCPDIATRTAQLDEACQIIKRLCREKRVSFEGTHYRLRDAPSALSPIQRPHPRITIGGGGERRTMPLVARHADVWNCPTYSLGELESKRDAMRVACETESRDSASLAFGQQAVIVLARNESELGAAQEIARRRFGGPEWGLEAGGFVGTPAQVVDQIGAKIDLGFTQFALFFHDRAEPETLACFGEEVIPALRS